MADTPRRHPDPDRRNQPLRFPSSTSCSTSSSTPRPTPPSAKLRARCGRLAQQALVSTQLISTDVLQSIEAMIAEIDKKTE